jgi:hypothetical protein
MVAQAQVLKWATALMVAAVVTAQPPGTPSTPAACTGAVTILINGQTLPGNVSGCVINLKTSTGSIANATPDPAIGGTDITFTPNSAIYPTYTQVEQGANFCDSAQGVAAYQCALPSNIGTSVQAGMEVLLRIDVPCPAACTLMLTATPGCVTQPPAGSTCGPQTPAIAIKQADGTTDPGGTGNLGFAGRAQRLWYDGTVFRME